MASHCAMKFCPSIDSVDIKYAICGRINCIPLQRKAVWTETRPFHKRDGDVIHSVLWLVKGRAIARLDHAVGCPYIGSSNTPGGNITTHAYNTYCVCNLLYCDIKNYLLSSGINNK